MTYEQVESFLAAVTCGNISAAADYLFVSQSTVSNRIQLMEQELGISLFIRKKGHRNIELTSYGEAFIPIASQWAALWKDTQNLKYAADIQTLQPVQIFAADPAGLPPFPDIQIDIFAVKRRDTRGIFGLFHAAFYFEGINAGFDQLRQVSDRTHVL